MKEFVSFSPYSSLSFQPQFWDELRGTWESRNDDLATHEAAGKYKRNRHYTTGGDFYQHKNKDFIRLHGVDWLTSLTSKQVNNKNNIYQRGDNI